MHDVARAFLKTHVSVVARPEPRSVERSPCSTKEVAAGSVAAVALPGNRIARLPTGVEVHAFLTGGPRYPEGVIGGNIAMRGRRAHGNARATEYRPGGIVSTQSRRVGKIQRERAVTFPAVVGVSVAERRIGGCLGSTAHPFINADRIQGQAARVHQRHDPGHRIQHLISGCPIDKIVPGSQIGTHIPREPHEGHQRVERDQRKCDRSTARKIHCLAPIAGRLRQQVLAVGRDGRGGVDGQRPLPPPEFIGSVRRAHRLCRKCIQVRVATEAVKRQQQTRACRLADMRVGDQHQDIAVRHLLDRAIRKGLKRAFLPPYRHIRVSA